MSNEKYTVTFFNDVYATDAATIERVTTTWDALKDWLKAGPHAPTKGALRLLSQSVYGDKRSAKESYRHAANVVGCWGVELDYDGERVPFETAVQRLREARVTFFAFTTPSHRPEAPRWRALLPFDRMEPPEAREIAAERANAIVGGWVARESFNLSSSFYAGRAADAVEYLTAEGSGDYVNRRVDLPRQGWLGTDTAAGRGVTTQVLADMLYDGEEVHNCITALAFRGWSEDELREAVENSRIRELRGEKRYAQALDDIRRGVSSAATKKQRDIERLLASIPPPPKSADAPLSTPSEDPLFSRVGEMTAVYRPTEWLVDGHIEHPTLSVIFGDSEVGKSFVVIDWVCSIATGRRWNGKKVLRGPVLYLAGEGFNGLSKRFLAWRLHNAVPEAEWNAAPLYVSRRAVDLLNFQAGAEMWAAVDALGVKPVLIVIDTLSRMTPGMNESAAEDMSKFVQWCDRTKSAFGCTILVVHHSGVGDKSRVRGSTVLRGATDVEIGAAREKDGRLKLFNTKMKEGRRFAERFFRFHDVTLPWIRQPDDDGEAPSHETSAVLIASDEPAGQAEKKANTAKDLLRTIIRDAGGKLDNGDALEQFIALKGGEREPARKRFYAVRKSAIDAGTVIFTPDDNLLRLPLMTLP